MTNKTQILLVEDNQEYAKTAREYLESRDLAVAYAKDYSEAVTQLKSSNQFKGVITDLFFPDRTGSNSISLGINLVDRLIGSTPSTTIKPDPNDMFSSPEEYTTIDYNSLLMEAMEKSETNQPLGIAIAEIADKMGLPFIIATSTYHHDNLTQPICEYAGKQNWNVVDCNPDLGESKADRKFWMRALSKLEEKLIK